jgi:nitrite reductase (NADH) small subunit
MSPIVESVVNIVKWFEVCAVEDIPVLGARVLRREGQTDIAIFRNTENKIFALLDECPHKKGPLSQGIVFGEKVACPLHNWTIGLSDGCALEPDTGCTPSYPIQVVNGRVRIAL